MYTIRIYEASVSTVTLVQSSPIAKKRGALNGAHNHMWMQLPDL